MLITAAFTLLQGCSDTKNAAEWPAPTGLQTVILVEADRRIDRNIRILLSERDGEPREIWLTPDEGRPGGTEEVVWNPAGTAFVIVGRHFFVPKQSMMPDGRSLYFAMQTTTGEMRCNSEQQTEFVGLDGGLLAEWGIPLLVGSTDD